MGIRFFDFRVSVLFLPFSSVGIDFTTQLKPGYCLYDSLAGVQGVGLFSTLPSISGVNQARFITKGFASSTFDCTRSSI